MTWFFGYRQGQVISCLRDVKAQVRRGCHEAPQLLTHSLAPLSQVAKKCKNQLFKVMMDAAMDFRCERRCLYGSLPLFCQEHSSVNIT